MKKNNALFLLTIIIVILLLVNSCQTEQVDEINKKNDLVAMNLLGNVKCIKQHSFDVNEKFGKAEKGERNYQDEFEISFDENGYIAERLTYNSIDSVDNKETFVYKDNLLIESDYYADDSLLSKVLYKYNQNGRLQSEEHYYGDGSLNYKWRFEYNKSNLDSLNIRYNYDNKMDLKINYQYDNKGNKSGEFRYGVNDSLIQKILYMYNEKRLKSEEKIISNDTLGSKYVFEYNDNGNLIKTQKYDLKGILYGIEEFNYDNDNNQTSKIYRFSDESLSSKQTMKYDKIKNMTEFIIFNSDDLPTQNKRLEYKYDSIGNWIRQTIYIDNIPEMIIIRELEYYPQMQAVKQ